MTAVDPHRRQHVSLAKDVFVLTSSGTITTTVPLGARSYSIRISSGQFSGMGDAIKAAVPSACHAVIVADQALAQPWAAGLHDALTRLNLRVSIAEVPSGETSKSIAQFDRLMNWMLQQRCDRRSVLIALGGGVVGDLAGFAAASYMRGIRLIQIPTTLLAMVDSSVGGKTGINLTGGKNMVGAFWQPSTVLIDTEVLSTLDQKTFLSGLGEVVKYGVIQDADFFQWLQTNAGRLVDRDPDALRHAIDVSCRCKASVVGADERESSGRRAILNYGHTFAHALEATAGYGVLLHGEAVSIGMQMAARLAVSLGMIDVDALDRQTRLLRQCELPIHFPDADPDAMLPVMMTDKKNQDGQLRLILPTRIGSVELVSGVDASDVIAAIKSTR